MTLRHKSLERRSRKSDDMVNTRQKDTIPANKKSNFCTCTPPPALAEGVCTKCKKPRKVF